MCFSRHLIENKTWTSYSRAEDLEHFLELAQANIRVQFAPEATVRAVMPSDPRNAESQRKRWEMARFMLMKRYAGRLVFSAIRNRSVMVLDSLIELMTPAFVNLFAVTTAAFIMNLAAIALGAWWLIGYAMIWGAAVVLDMFHVIGGLSAAHADHGAYAALVNVPKYALWKLKVYVKTLLGGDDKHWVRTAREDSAPSGMNLGPGEKEVR